MSSKNLFLEGSTSLQAFVYYSSVRSLLFTTTSCVEISYLLYDPIREDSGTPLQYSCLENPMDGGAWWVAVHGVAKSWTQLSYFTFTFHFHALEREMVTHSSVLACESQGRGSLVSCHLWGRTESDTTEAT